MKTSYDVFAETNPALCAGSLLSFVSAHHSEKGIWPELIVSYFVLPIALSQDTAGAFEGTNKTTGLMAWLGRNPDVSLWIADRVHTTAQITNEAISFGCFSGLLAIDKTNGQITAGTNAADPIKAAVKAGKDAERAVKMSQRLGYWFGSCGSSKSIYSAFGVRP